MSLVLREPPRPGSSWRTRVPEHAAPVPAPAETLRRVAVPDRVTFGRVRSGMAASLGYRYLATCLNCHTTVVILNEDLVGPAPVWRHRADLDVCCPPRELEARRC